MKKVVLKKSFCLSPSWLFLVASIVATDAQAEEAVELKTIKIIGENTSQQDDVSARRDAATQKVIVNRKEIENLGVMTIGEVLGKLPGVEIKGGGQRARGMSRDSVQILVDGERQGGGAMGASGVLARLPADNLERVEILRGSSAEFGGASVLTVNLVLKKALAKRSTDVKLGLGIRGDELNEQLSWTETGGSGNFSWSLPISLNYNNSPINSSAQRQDGVAGVNSLIQQERTNGVSKFGHHAISPRLTWKSGSDSLTISPMFFYGPLERDSTTTLTQYSNPATATGLVNAGTRDSSEDGTNRMLRLRVDGEKHFGDAKFTARIAVNNGHRSSDVVRDELDATNVHTTFVEHTKSRDREFNTAMRVDKPFDAHLLSTGLEYAKVNRDDQQLFGGGFSTTGNYQAYSRDEIAWIQDDWTPIDAFTLTTGLRLENMTIAAESVSQQRAGLLPSVAARWQPSEQWVLRTSLGAGMKMPKLNEISNTTTRSVAANTPVEADKRGNANLLPERNVNFEAVVERYLPEKMGVLGANVYIRSTSDFIEHRVQQEGLRWVDRPYNEGDALHYGLELDGKLRTDRLGWKGATVKAHLTLPHAEVDDKRLGITRMARDTPRYILSMGLDQNLPQLKSSYGVSLQVSGRSSTKIPDEQVGFSESRALLDAYWLYKLSPKFNLRFSGQNLLKADTRNQNTFVEGSNRWQLNSNDIASRNVMITLEGHW